MDNITENNKLIAEFLGEIKQPFEFPQFGYINIMGDWKDTFFDNQLKFHSNWNWLMQVVEKILNVSLEIDSMEMYYNITDSIPYIAKTYGECVEFIKWYNEQK